jgi:hypothetical protein
MEPAEPASPVPKKMKPEGLEAPGGMAAAGQAPPPEDEDRSSHLPDAVLGDKVSRSSPPGGATSGGPPRLSISIAMLSVSHGKGRFSSAPCQASYPLTRALAAAFASTRASVPFADRTLLP